MNGPSIEILDDQNNVLSGTQVVNVGEHVSLSVNVQPAGTVFTNPQWMVTGLHIRDWITKDAEIIHMTIDDYLAGTIHFVWKDTTTPLAPNIVRVSVLAGGAILSAELTFQVERQPKPEKFYSDDRLMEYHNNWHSVYSFSAASTRRGDLFLAWHRSQLEYFDKWREYFGYPPVPNWDPTMPWVAGLVPESKQHPSTTTAPANNNSSRHDLVTPDLTGQGLAHSTEGEYDLVTQNQGRGTNSEFVDAGYVLRSETVKEVLDLPDIADFSKVGIATQPVWLQPNTGQSVDDPWFAAGCPARANPGDVFNVQTCAVQSKRSFDDYTLRELGESVESGQYAANFVINYHALGHIATSEDMSNPATSMRDPIFWAWHKHLDGILSAWQSTKGVEAGGPVMIYTRPVFMEDWTVFRVAFSNRVVPEFVLPDNVMINGSPATTVTDVSFTGTGYIFEFTGFPVPADGTVEAVVRREINTGIRTSAIEPRPAPTLIMSTFGQLLTPAVNRFYYSKP